MNLKGRSGVAGTRRGCAMEGAGGEVGTVMPGGARCTPHDVCHNEREGSVTVSA